MFCPIHLSRNFHFTHLGSFHLPLFALEAFPWMLCFLPSLGTCGGEGGKGQGEEKQSLCSFSEDYLNLWLSEDISSMWNLSVFSHRNSFVWNIKYFVLLVYLLDSKDYSQSLLWTDGYEGCVCFVFPLFLCFSCLLLPRFPVPMASFPFPLSGSNHFLTPLPYY